MVTPSAHPRLPAACRSVVLALALILIAACAGSSERFSTSDQVSRLYGRAYDQIADLYIEPLAPSQLALAGLAQIASLDHDIVIERGGSDVVLRRQGGVVSRLPAPSDDDAPSWGAVTSLMLQSAKAASADIARTPEEKLQQTVFDGILGKLDRFSRYAPPEVAREHRASRDGFGGIGVTLDYAKDEVRVTAVLPGSPAARGGVQVDDRITGIDGVEVATLTRTDVVRRLRGPIDSRVEVTLARAGRAEPVKVSLARAFIVVPTVTTKVEDGLAVMRVTSFNHSTAQQLAEQLAAARRPRGTVLRGIILDLRGNPGGLLDQSVAVADLFLEGGPIVATRGRHPASQQQFRATQDDIADGLPIAVLVNGGSASASEIVAAALQDRRRAVVIGSASYGKGTVQTVLRLPNDGELTLTWARLVSPAGYTLNEHGVVPTICTTGLGDNDAAVTDALRRATVAAPRDTPAGQRRADLDEPGWGVLRKSCPTHVGDLPVEMHVAKRLLSDRALYARALRPDPENVAASRTAAE